MQNMKQKKIRYIRFQVMYDGTSYSGWQRVTNTKSSKPSIQSVIEENLTQLLSEEIMITASGRTDAGVHAISQVVNFKTKNAIELRRLTSDMNQRLPEDISIYNVAEVSKEFHSRYDAKKKTYVYYIDVRERESVFNRKYSYPLGKMLDINMMKEAASYLIGTHDFKAFCTDRKDGKSTVRTIYDIKIEQMNDRYGASEVIIEITGNGFLYNMVRIIVGSLVEVGLLQRTSESIHDALVQKNRMKAGMTLGSQGLFLKNVEY